MKFFDILTELTLSESFSDNAYVFDFDDTLFHTDCKIEVRDKKTGGVVKRLSSAQFNHYKLDSGEEFDFSEFEDVSRIMAGKPAKMLRAAQNISDAVTSGKSNSVIYVVTARAGMGTEDAITSVLNKHGVFVKRENVYAAGNTAKDTGDIPTEKSKIVKSIRERHGGKIMFYDDSSANVAAVKDVKGVNARKV